VTHPHWPLLCDAADKAEREAQNSVEQIEYIRYWVNDLGAVELREAHVTELQSLAVKGIYPCGARYRSATQDVRISNSNHILPEPARVRGLVVDTISLLNSKRGSWSKVRRAAYALWRFNWIHPFAGGNGRMSRALAYMIVCMDRGAMLPGVPTMPHIIALERDEYIQALQAADAETAAIDPEAIGDAAVPNLQHMEAFLAAVLIKQLTIALEAHGMTSTSALSGTLSVNANALHSDSEPPGASNK